jgi:hypothetical protein
MVLKEQNILQNRIHSMAKFPPPLDLLFKSSLKGGDKEQKGEYNGMQRVLNNLIPKFTMAA